ncbi:Catechol 2,3-dioxygenase [Filimonas lacunae]|uniref:Catechol 2,3-dioxygenase n=1 Tax=Filimonas lacunae TaxID=477680 RepID=A0A173MHF2_9BACT|nr:VOC family protein [Filimonas lacunae]BAV06919.1 glyoxalase family protein [Filimonas lacunae]SIS97829.1 Catechol 2,3-dioxygenase [Filimonas lacunae]
MKMINNISRNIVSGIVAPLALTVGGFNTSAKAQAPGIVGIDHVGINVPNLEQGVQFFHDLFGFEQVTKLGPFAMDANWKKNFHIHDNAGAVTVVMMRAGDGSNIELFGYTPPVGSTVQPYRDDISATHISLYTTDIKATKAFLESKGIQFLTDINAGMFDTEGESWVYFETPWGASIELNSYPNGKGYEKQKPAVKLWNPATAAQLTTETYNKAFLQSFAVKQVAVWNETDSVARLPKLKEIYQNDIAFFDEEGSTNGIASLNARISKLQQQNARFKFSLIKIDNSNNMVRYYWNYGPASKPNLISGMDLIILEGGKIRTLNVFLDKLPPAAK